MADQDKGKTYFRRVEQYKDRWSSLGGGTGIVHLSEKPDAHELKKYDIFKDYDEKFLDKISQDVSIAKWKKGNLLFEEGSYIDIAFFIVEGNVEVFLQKHRESVTSGAPIFDRSRTVFNVPVEAQATVVKPAHAGETVFDSQLLKQDRSGANITFLSSMDFDLPTGNSMKLGAGELFGEIGALTGWPQSVTAKTVSECTLVQIRVPALRLMRKRNKNLKERLDRIYRERSLAAQLRATPLFHGCDDAFIDALKGTVSLVSCEPDEIITREGEPPDALYLVRSGFVRLSQRLAEGEIVVSYLSKGSTLGEAELLLDGLKGWVYTASSKEYTELVKIPKDRFLELAKRYPRIERMLWESVVNRTKEAGYSRKNISQSEFIETALDNGLVEGNSILVIDLNTCTRCDDCVRGCADTHDGVPRFVREGDKYENLLITRACNHCRDPVCLVGCPTGAIRRAAVGDVVEIDPKLCIGCASCSNNCPYDAIVMYDTGEVWPANAVPEALRGKDRQLATKCDLCYKDPAGPACVRSCPNGCAFRVGSIEEFQKLVTRD